MYSKFVRLERPKRQFFTRLNASERYTDCHARGVVHVERIP